MESDSGDPAYRESKWWIRGSQRPESSGRGGAKAPSSNSGGVGSRHAVASDSHRVETRRRDARGSFVLLSFLSFTLLSWRLRGFRPRPAPTEAGGIVLRLRSRGAGKASIEESAPDENVVPVEAQPSQIGDGIVCASRSA